MNGPDIAIGVLAISATMTAAAGAAAERGARRKAERKHRLERIHLAEVDADRGRAERLAAAGWPAPEPAIAAADIGTIRPAPTAPLTAPLAAPVYTIPAAAHPSTGAWYTPPPPRPDRSLWDGPRTQPAPPPEPEPEPVPAGAVRTAELIATAVTAGLPSPATYKLAALHLRGIRIRLDDLPETTTRWGVVDADGGTYCAAARHKDAA